jgi:hypothetical protein
MTVWGVWRKYRQVVALVGGEHSGTTLAQLDLNGDGAIDRGEFDLFMHSVLPTEESALDAACDAMRRRLLQWQDSVIAALVSSGRVDRADSPLVDQLWTLFRRWDAKKDNVLCMEELAAALAECHVPVDLATQKFGWTEATALSPLQFAEVFISLWPEVNRRKSPLTCRLPLKASFHARQMTSKTDATMLSCPHIKPSQFLGLPHRRHIAPSLS